MALLGNRKLSEGVSSPFLCIHELQSRHMYTALRESLHTNSVVRTSLLVDSFPLLESNGFV